jgi:endonuclease/exonuclease/phosphatase family metal-dependent hydrolase
MLGQMFPAIVAKGFCATQQRDHVGAGGGLSTVRKLELWHAVSEMGLIFTTICITSYPFVPGGFFFRDHFQYFLISACACVGFAFVKLSTTLPGLAARPDAKRSVLTPGIFVFLLASSLVLSGWRHLIDTPDNSAAPSSPALVIGEDTSKDIQCIPGRSSEKTVSFMVWTIHFGLDNWGTDSCDRLYQLIAKTDADVIGLLETDMSRLVNGARDVVEYLAYRLGFKYVDFGPTSMDSTFGSAIISRYPIVKLHRHIMPSPVGELAPMIEAVLDIEGTPVVTFVGHFGNTDHIWDLRLQSQFLGQRAAATDLPAVFLGYLTTDVHRGNYHYMVRREGTQQKLPIADEHLKDRMEHRRLFKDTAYQMYMHSQWLTINSEQRDLMKNGSFQRALGSNYNEPRFRSVGNRNEFRRGTYQRDYRLPAVSEPGGVAEKAEQRLMAAEDTAGDRDDAFWDSMKANESIWREQDLRNDTFIYYPNAGRIGNAHPRWEYWDRYCQHILYKPGFELDANTAKCGATKMHLFDWFRWNFVNDLSDTEIQVARFRFTAKDPLRGPE